MNETVKYLLQNKIKDIVITRLLSTVTFQASQILQLKEQCEQYKRSIISSMKISLMPKHFITSNQSDNLSRNYSKVIFDKPPVKWNPTPKWKSAIKPKQKRLLEITKSIDSLQNKPPAYIHSQQNDKTIMTIPISRHMTYSSKAMMTKTIQQQNSLKKVLSRFLGQSPIPKQSRTFSAELREDKEKNISVISVKINQSKQPYIFVNTNQTSNSLIDSYPSKFNGKI